MRSHLGFNLLKEMGAIALSLIFSREILRAVKKAIAILENENVGRCDRA
ncbi:hypothetical protein [Cylindrospermopsis raciborskii]|nr:hypothetical protein [Cylindrospermopsis raciborskii]